MAASNSEIQERCRLYKFTKVLTLKVAQIVVQSRKGKKISQDFKPQNGVDSTPPLQWFNLSIPDEPGVNEETKRVLNGEVVDALSKVLSIEITLRTTDGDEMVLELWTVKLTTASEICSPSTIYYRMGVMLKSTLTISRITPAYKLARTQHKETYKISHRIFSGEPNFEKLGENRRNIKISELRTPIGTITIGVSYRTKMTILPEDRPKFTYGITTSGHDIMVKSDHFKDTPKKKRGYEKKELDLSKPLTNAAFVDKVKMQELQDSLCEQLPPEPPMTWLIAEREQIDKKLQNLDICKVADAEDPTAKLLADAAKTATTSASSYAASKAIDIPRANAGDQCKRIMEFPFAEGSPIADLANFYNECLQARAMTKEWKDFADTAAISTDSDTLSKQLKMFEDAVPEFDSMVASMCNSAEGGSEN
ncbi:autophagy-related protein 13 homolog [Bombyx mori]|uniref:Autophagy-related protein 13 n=1 Tax=Bombyx mori TaxID=7091 RepID=A0A8R2LW13_BOMMO|nr:autophagy-related protein 13 homolog [Bombyx mori]